MTKRKSVISPNGEVTDALPRVSRILTAAAALLLGAMYLLPLWYIKLLAPQYPEGIGMYIRLNTLRGETEFDLTRINTLNHYVGMKPIAAESIPELRYMPWIVGALVISGLLVAIVSNRKLLIGWVASFAAIGVAGMIDFYRWEYDYGHNLAADAIIKIPGMTYQPPVIGIKHLLNFTAQSWPASGAFAAGLAFTLAIVAVSVARRSHKRFVSLGALAFGLAAE